MAGRGQDAAATEGGSAALSVDGGAGTAGGGRFRSRRGGAVVVLPAAEGMSVAPGHTPGTVSAGVSRCMAGIRTCWFSGLKGGKPCVSSDVNGDGSLVG